MSASTGISPTSNSNSNSEASFDLDEELIGAIISLDLDEVSAALDDGADVNVRISFNHHEEEHFPVAGSGATPLTLALCKGDGDTQNKALPLISCLVSRGADLILGNEESDAFPLSVAATRYDQEFSAEALKILLASSSTIFEEISTNAKYKRKVADSVKDILLNADTLTLSERVLCLLFVAGIKPEEICKGATIPASVLQFMKICSEDEIGVDVSEDDGRKITELRALKREIRAVFDRVDAASAGAASSAAASAATSAAAGNIHNIVLANLAVMEHLMVVDAAGASVRPSPFNFLPKEKLDLVIPLLVQAGSSPVLVVREGDVARNAERAGGATAAASAVEEDSGEEEAEPETYTSSSDSCDEEEISRPVKMQRVGSAEDEIAKDGVEPSASAAAVSTDSNVPPLFARNALASSAFGDHGRGCRS